MTLYILSIDRKSSPIHVVHHQSCRYRTSNKLNEVSMGIYYDDNEGFKEAKKLYHDTEACPFCMLIKAQP